ncbi:metalloregulator ArsR/SmtB family transcription factor [soil metagenome]
MPPAPVARGFDLCQYRGMSNQVELRPVHRAALNEPECVPLASMFKALGDPARLRLLSLIASHSGGEACVCDISGTFDLSQPTISHHLKTLKLAGLLDSERRGSWVYYRVIPSALQQLSAILQIEDGPTELSETCQEETQR